MLPGTGWKARNKMILIIRPGTEPKGYTGKILEHPPESFRLEPDKNRLFPGTVDQRISVRTKKRVQPPEITRIILCSRNKIAVGRSGSHMAFKQYIERFVRISGIKEVN